VAGRRSGKSFILAAIATFVAAFTDFTPYLSPGETPTILICASDKQQAGILLRYIRSFFQGSAVLRSMLVSDLKETITLKSGLEIVVMAGDFRTIRGRTIVCCLLDELAFFASDGSSPDTELVAAIRPSQISIPNSLLLGISSPYSRKGVLYNEYQQHYGKDTSDTLIWQSNSLTMNPTLNAKAIESAYAKDPVSAASEYGGNFRNDLESYISREAVEACIVRGRDELPFRKGVEYRAFADISGGVSDSFAMAIAHAEGTITVLDLSAEVPGP
jgi:hypothetical protein